MHTLTTTIAALAAAILLTNTAHGLTPADKCEAAKLKIAGKYGFCRLKAESKAVKVGGTPDYSVCDAKYGSKWSTTETIGGGHCPSNFDQAGIQGFITQHTDDVTVALAGGALSDCPADLATCTSDLTICNGSLAPCNANLTTTTVSLNTCNTNLTSTTTSLTTCTASLASSSSDLATVNAGTATPADVLNGKTFSSSSGLGLTGTMPNNGTVNITPSTSSQTITAGYHNGFGSVAGDADLVAENIKNGVDVFGVTGTLLNPPLSTGQTTAYGTGSDGDLQKGVSQSFTDNGDGTITDNTTALMWEKKDRSGGIHDYNNTYTWGMIFSPYTMNGTMVTTFLTALNSGGGFAGHTDWRIPNLNELESIRDMQNYYPAANAVFYTASCMAGCTVASCSCTQPGSYWSSTTYRFSPGVAWGVYFDVGGVNPFSNSAGNYVRAVRGGS